MSVEDTTEARIRADLTTRRAALLAERERAVAQYQQLSQAIPMLTGAINEVERLLSGFDQSPPDDEDARLNALSAALHRASAG